LRRKIWQSGDNEINKIQIDMKKFKKENRDFSKQLLVMLFVISVFSVSAKTPSEFSIYGGGGYSFFYHRPTLSGVYGVSSGGFGGDLGIGFTGFAGKQIGFHIGLGIGIYNVKTMVDSLVVFTPNYDHAINPLDGTEHLYDLYTNLSGYDETHRMFFVTIPLMLQFQTPAPERSWNNRGAIRKGFYAMTGVKLNLLIESQYETEVKSLKNLAHFTVIDNWAGTQEFVELGRFKGNTAKGQFKYILPVLTFEAGLKWYFPPKLILYTGAYFEYGLNDPTKDNRGTFDNYTSRDDLKNLSLLKFSDNSDLMSVGIKLRLAFVKQKQNPLPCPAIIKR